ncbi:MAG: cobyric acid synthase [Firmicutes bacterium]|nr:cobyric acid synthase [Bacillota bacterium]
MSDTDVTTGVRQHRLRSVMLVGTASNVGKSVLCAALCRIFAQDGISVAPFKAQNMSLNAAVTPSGAEIGRAQAMQAEAAGIEPTEHMNPVLLKPTGEMSSQVIVQGKAVGTVAARDYFADHKAKLWRAVCESYDHLRERFELIVIEGAGSPVELNLKERDIANMRAAEMADAAVILVADIDRGGIFASVLGTLLLLTPSERARVCGIIVNRFRGDPSLFVEGVQILEERAGIPVLGVVPFIKDLQIDEEDSVGLRGERYRREEDHSTVADDLTLKIAVVRIPYISNFTDLDPLFIEPGVDVYFTVHPQELEQADAIIIPGSKNTISDLLWMREAGMADAIIRAAQAGKQILGICGGFQMLGESVRDPEGQESPITEAPGLGLHPGVTTISAVKRTVLVHGQVADRVSVPVHGYEMHMGETLGIPVDRAFAHVQDACAQSGQAPMRHDGYRTDDGQVIGTYLHGVLHNDAFRLTWLNRLRRLRRLPEQTSGLVVSEVRARAYDHLADVVRTHVQIDRLYECVGKSTASVTPLPTA